MKYKGTEVKNSTPIAGVKMIHRGKNKGMWQAFYQDGNGIFTGNPHRDKNQAQFDLSLLKARVYI